MVKDLSQEIQPAYLRVVSYCWEGSSHFRDWRLFWSSAQAAETATKKSRRRMDSVLGHSAARRTWQSQDKGRPPRAKSSLQWSEID